MSETFQSMPRFKHIIEAATQVTIGAVLIFLSNLLFMPVLGIEATAASNAYLVAINTVVAFAKSYGVRAFFRGVVK